MSEWIKPLEGRTNRGGGVRKNQSARIGLSRHRQRNRETGEMQTISANVTISEDICRVLGWKIGTRLQPLLNPKKGVMRLQVAPAGEPARMLCYNSYRGRAANKEYDKAIIRIPVSPGLPIPDHHIEIDSYSVANGVLDISYPEDAVLWKEGFESSSVARRTLGKMFNGEVRVTSSD